MRKVFRTLHDNNKLFVIPNPYDVGTSILLTKHLGFQAIASSSGNLAFSLGKQDGTVSMELTLEHLKNLVKANPNHPVNADYGNGFAGADLSQLRKNVQRCLDTRVAGFSIEDLKDDGTLFSFEEAVERVRAAKQQNDANSEPAFLTARTEYLLTETKNPNLDMVIKRLEAFAHAGADCLFAPGIKSKNDIKAVVRALWPKPVNVLWTSPSLSLQELRELGVARVSFGSGLSRVAIGQFLHVASEVKDKETFNGFSTAYPYQTLQKVFEM